MLRVVFFSLVGMFCVRAEMVRLKTADIRRLAPETAEQARQVCIDGTVLCDFSSHIEPGFVLGDESGGVYILYPDPLRSGTRVTVEGITSKGRYASVVTARKVIRRGTCALPPPKLISAEQLCTGEHDYTQVAVRGVICSVQPDNELKNWLWFILKTPNRETGILFPVSEQPKIPPEHLIDADVEVTGICMPIYNTRREFLGARINITSSDSIRILNPVPAEAFSVPELRTDAVLNYAVIPPVLHRRRISGVVTAVWRDSIFYIQYGDRGMRVTAPGADSPTPGDVVEVSGFIDGSEYFAGINYALCRTTGTAPLPVPKPIKASELFSAASGVAKIARPDYNGTVISLTGTLRNIDTVSPKTTRIYINSDGRLIPVECGFPIQGFPLGSRLEISGVCRMTFSESRPAKDFPVVTGITLISRSPQDISVLEVPSPWTVPRLLGIIGGLVCAVLVILLWNLSLRRKVEKRTHELLQEETARIGAELQIAERTRLAAELHDAFAQNLTGIALQFEAAELAAVRAPEKLSDYFKAIRKMLTSCREEIRRCVWNLKAQALNENDFAKAAELIAAQYKGTVDISIERDGSSVPLSDSTTHHLLRITQELIANSIRHGKASRIELVISFRPDRFSLSVNDNGCGFNPNEAPGSDAGHFGLRGIHERVKRINALFEFNSSPGAGTQARIILRFHHEKN